MPVVSSADCWHPFRPGPFLTCVLCVQDQLTAYVHTIDAAFEKYNLPEQTQVWIQVICIPPQSNAAV